jgi:hypothetical protein
VDIEPTYQVASNFHDEVIMLDGCHGIIYLTLDITQRTHGDEVGSW